MKKKGRRRLRVDGEKGRVDVDEGGAECEKKKEKGGLRWKRRKG